MHCCTWLAARRFAAASAGRSFGTSWFGPRMTGAGSAAVWRSQRLPHSPRGTKKQAPAPEPDLRSLQATIRNQVSECRQYSTIVRTRIRRLWRKVHCDYPPTLPSCEKAAGDRAARHDPPDPRRGENHPKSLILKNHNQPFFFRVLAHAVESLHVLSTVVDHYHLSACAAYKYTLTNCCMA